MRHLAAFVFSLLVATTARADLDAMTASLGGSLAWTSFAPEGQRWGASLGQNGITFTHGGEGGFLIGSLALPSATVELGWGENFWRSETGAGHIWAAFSGLFSPRGGWSAGGRMLVGFGWLFEGTDVFWRPSITGSVGVAGGSTPEASLQLPLAASVEVGLVDSAFRPYLRVGAGVDMFAGTFWTGRGELAIGFAFNDLKAPPPPAP